jgi:hypothetical protein
MPVSPDSCRKGGDPSRPEEEKILVSIHPHDFSNFHGRRFGAERVYLRY